MTVVCDDNDGDVGGDGDDDELHYTCYTTK